MTHPVSRPLGPRLDRRTGIPLLEKAALARFVHEPLLAPSDAASSAD